MAPEGTVLSGISQTEKDKPCFISHMLSKKTKHTETENRLVVASSGSNRKGSKKYKLPVIREISSGHVRDSMLIYR